jgi:hypothetical protein
MRSMRLNWKRIAIIGATCFIALTAASYAVEPIARLDRIRDDRVVVTGIDLIKGGDFTIKGIGMINSHSDDFAAYGWLLDSQTREPIWVMERDNTERKGRDGLRQADDKINLKAGKYELYFYAATGWMGEINIKGDNVFEFFGDIFDGDFRNDVEDHLDEYYIALYPPSDNFREFSTFTPEGGFANALIQFTKVGDSKYLQQGFKLDKPTTVRIYGLTEFPSGYKTPADYAWVINADSREKVWEMDRWNTEPAGGGRKNRKVDEEVDFEKGNYVILYVTDDSHSYEEFNVMPPYDPFNWGVALLPISKTDQGAFHLYEPPGRGDALISLTRIGDDESVSQAFKLDKEMELRVLCLGEWAGEFADYGWIENASTGRSVWEMTHRNTEHAGGAQKNRQFDGTVTLPKGSYMAHYITDGSHSYDDWNDSPPYEADKWGLTIYPGSKFDKSIFHLLNENQLEQSADILVKMTGLGDNIRKRAQFTISSQTKIRIYAVGEGDQDEMFDFGWIVNDKTGKVVWEMTWRNTEPAGGASKNRLYDDSIILEAGAYEVNFITDGSHSFNDWNSAKPRDPASWGITVSIDKGETGAYSKASKKYSIVIPDNDAIYFYCASSTKDGYYYYFIK